MTDFMVAEDEMIETILDLVKASLQSHKDDGTIYIDEIAKEVYRDSWDAIRKFVANELRLRWANWED